MHILVSILAFIQDTSVNFCFPCRTDNPLQTAVLNLFVSLKSRFPNLVVGNLTRDSVKKALTNGITADQVCRSKHAADKDLFPFFAIQIIKYLTAHAHPQMRKNVSGSVETLWHRRIKDRSQNPMVPVTVQDQIRLWELERNRLKSQEGMLYKIRY